MWWQKRDNEAGCWVFSHPKKLCMNIEHPWKSASFLLMKDLLWKTLIIIDPAEKWWWVFILHLLCQLLMGIIMPLYIRVKSTKKHHWDSICGPQRLYSISGPTTTDARCILRQFFYCIPNFFASIGLVNSIFCTTASVAQQWNNWIFSGKISIRIGKIQMIHSCVVDLRTLWELLF